MRTNKNKVTVDFTDRHYGLLAHNGKFIAEVGIKWDGSVNIRYYDPDVILPDAVSSRLLATLRSQLPREYRSHRLTIVIVEGYLSYGYSVSWRRYRQLPKATRIEIRAIRDMLDL